MTDCYKCGFWDHDREGCTCAAPDRSYACPIVLGTIKKETSEIDRMHNELEKYCRNFLIHNVLCKQNGRQCIFYPYCSTHSDFEDKDVKRLYERMKKKLEASDGEKD